MKGELHLPDLPEIPVAVSAVVPAVGGGGGGERRERPGWLAPLREKLMGYIPLLLMIVLALGTWLIAKNSPGLLSPSTPGAVKHVPDYTVDHFTLQRFDIDGALKVQIDGDHMRHYPDDDTMEVDKIRVVSTDPNGGKMTATAQQGRAKGDGSEVWLDGQAQVVSEETDKVPVQMNGEHLRAEPKLKRVDSDWPVIVQQGDSEFHSEGMFYDADTRVMRLRGVTHALLQPKLRGAVGKDPKSGKAGAK